MNTENQIKKTANGALNTYGVSNMAERFNAIDPLDPESGRKLVELKDGLALAASIVKSLRENIDAALITYIQKYGDIPVGLGQRLYVGTVKKTKCVDDSGLLKELLEKLNGDLERIVSGPEGVLCANPWKIGAVRFVIGDEKVEEFFETITEYDLKTGVNKKVLKIVDTEFTRKRRN